MRPWQTEMHYTDVMMSIIIANCMYKSVPDILLVPLNRGRPEFNWNKRVVQAEHSFSDIQMDVPGSVHAFVTQLYPSQRSYIYLCENEFSYLITLKPKSVDSLGYSVLFSLFFLRVQISIVAFHPECGAYKY
jgi:hypothetical protein